MKKIIAVGNALVDIMTLLENDEFLTKFSLGKGSMQLVDNVLSSDILKAAEGLKKQLASGGSSANTIHGIANLGGNTAYIGTIGTDEYGRFFKEDLENAGIKAFLYEREAETGRAIAMVSLDSERTFATFLGAAVEVSDEHIVSETIKDFDIIHLEGYLVLNKKMIEKAMTTAKEHGLKVSIDMSSYNVVEQNRDYLEFLIRNYVDIVFANEDEAKSFTNTSPEKALDIIAEMVETAVVKLGKNGSLVKHKGEYYKIEPVVADCIDTTGAGDLFAAGFLYGLANDLPIDKCGKIGSLLASNVIELVGAKISRERWEILRKQVAAI
jgi:sugar/nucleoside kinase (ribokinase family)